MPTRQRSRPRQIRIGAPWRIDPQSHVP
ncbi:MAG: hypothetical protein ACJA1E_001684, partial [Paracoccaceae bacterium]